MGFWAQVRAILWKDIVVELRTKERLSSMFFFALLIIVVFNFAFEPGTQAMREIAPGILWVTFIFAGLLGLTRSFTMERENGCLQGLLLCPADRGAIFVGKALGNAVFMTIVEVISLPFFSVFLNVEVLPSLGQLIPLMILGTLGFSAVGTLFAAMSANTKMREVMLPLLLFPILVPIMLAVVEGTKAALTGEGLDGVSGWIKIAVTFCVLFTAASVILFDYVVED